ncbi:hypothetical protein WM40_07750 [Robbsia andropogonis]|uniref:ATP-grasp domain-containing protein n=2 Tax=Robbsia andropogonis TaxID=28092 RepID=A0A0F5K219_9BURK|nr:hypothetical protein [Robbsia andropogonis]KKB63980.1 hypothetical protein WM40_07750 [Robbsia andropogonis]
MDSRIGTDSVRDWKNDLVSNSNATFVWISDSSQAVFTSADPDATITLHRESSFLWIADIQDVVVLNEAPSSAFISYVKKIRGFSPNILAFENPNVGKSFTAYLAGNQQMCDQLARLRTPDTYFYPDKVTADIEIISQATSIPIAGLKYHRVYNELNDKGIGRRLCMMSDIKVPLGVECSTVGSLREALRVSEAAPLRFPLLAKEGAEESGGGHTLMTSQAEADQFLRRFENKPNEDAISYAVETFLDVPPEQNFSFRVFVGQSGKVTLTDLHRSWVTPPNFQAYKAERPHAFDMNTVSDITCAAQKIGTALFEHGFSGSAGIDGVLSRDGTTYPALDINPRLTGDVWMMDLVRLFNRPFYSMEMHLVRGVPLDVEFHHVESLLQRLAEPTRDVGSVVILALKRKTSLRAHAEGRQTLLIKSLTLGTSLENMRSLAGAVGETVQRLAS